MRFPDVVNVKAEGYDYENAPHREKILKLGQKITDRKLRKINYDDPEYYGLAAITTDLEADIALTMKLRTEYPISDMMKMTKKLNLTQEELEKHLYHMGYMGLIEWHYKNNPDGTRERLYVLPKFVMGSAEFANMRRDTIEKNPEVARFFERMCFDPLNGLTHMIPPGGAGVGMHVIPVEKAIENASEATDIEHISYWLDKYEGHIAASPCSCTMCEEVLGQGDGRDERDWCIALGDIADYTVETDKGHYISKERALEICLQAEKNGYVHQITNNDGKKKIIAICNCDPKICHALRTSQLFNTPNLSRSAFIAHVDKEKCVACGQCVEYCPSGAVRLGRKLKKKDGSLAVNPRIEDPAVTKWDRSKWSENYNDTNRVNCYPAGTAPCKTSCPAHIAIQGYLKLARLGLYDRALELIKKNNPLPAICGRICNKPCEDVCTRGDIDRAVAIDDVKKFLADRDLDAKTRYIPQKEVPSAAGEFDQKIAIVGSGPAGLSCAYYLALKGYHPTIFEKNKMPGGMLYYGVPSYKLEKDVIMAEIEVIKALGVDIKTGVEVGKDITLKELREQGYKGFYLAVGCQGGRRPGVPGDSAKGTDIAVDFLRSVADDHDQKIENDVVVVGGGNVAVDCARTAKRLGAKNVTMVSLETRDTMPASEEEIIETIEDGIEVKNGWGPKEIKTDKNGRVSAVVFKKCIRTIDPETNKFSPVYMDDHTEEIKATRVIFAIGQSIVWGDLLKDEAVETARNGAPKADPLTYQTQQPDVFVGGDVYTGPSFAINAIAAGREAAISLARAVHEGCTLDEGRNRNDFVALNKDDMLVESYDRTPRQEIALDPKYDPHKSWRDSRTNLTPKQVEQEASRCLSCGAAEVDPNKCIGCGICTTKCMFYAITISRDLPEANDLVPCEDTMKKVLPYAIKRVFRIKKHNRELKKQAKAEAKAKKQANA